MLTSKQRAALRAAANQIDTIFQIGKGDINDNLIKQIDDALTARELVKIHILETSGLTPKEASRIVCEKTGAETVQCIGNKFTLFRRNTKNPKYVF